MFLLSSSKSLISSKILKPLGYPGCWLSKYCGGGGVQRSLLINSSNSGGSRRRIQTSTSSTSSNHSEPSWSSQNRDSKTALERTTSSSSSRSSSWKRLPRFLFWFSPFPILALFSYQEFKRFKDPKHPLRHWEVSCYRMLPWNTLSRGWGYINSVYLPVGIRSPILGLYASAFGCELGEAEVEDLKEYKNLGEFFRRALKPGVRPVCPESPIVHPADGTVLHSGLAEEGGMVEQVKGVSYSLQAFLGPNSWKDNASPSAGDEYIKSLLHDPEKNALYTMVIYLAPGDYHRFHTPADWKIEHRRHFPGELLSVNPHVARWISGLFTLNERAVYLGSWTHGFFSMTAVGATNVGSIKVYEDPELATNTKKSKRKTQLPWSDKPLSLNVKKGEAFGEFNLGSTIVLLFEAPKGHEVKEDVINQKVKVGTPLLPPKEK